MQKLIGFSRSTLILLVTAMLSISPVAAVESDTLTDIGKQIEQHHVVRAEFTQTKQMADLKRPLITRGKLVYSRDHGVLWQIEQPYRIGYVLGEEKIVEISAHGVRKERGMRDIPGLAQVGRVFRAMLGANTVALKSYFDASVQGDTSQWAIQLTPKQAQLKQFLTQLKLQGSRFVETIDIDENNGDRTTIRFTDSQAATTLSLEELQLLTGLAKQQ
ncbi:hypothetical protein MTYP_00744 [Methylophilaceae bacterium]|nr:hypothetical protein MTYP_00744 [Methylophilaceae bacterium]